MTQFSQLINLLLFAFTVYGISTVISQEYIFEPTVDIFKKYKFIYYLLTCNKCLSVWVGMFLSLLGFTITNPFCDAFIAYTATCILNKLLSDTEPD